jgi:putative inorganic carbon (HCO3(-)) transporter
MENKLTNNKLNWVYLSGLFLIVCLPLLSIPPFFHPADWGKSIVFKIIFSLLLLIFCRQMLYHQEYRFLVWQKLRAIPKWISVSFAGFLIFLILSTIFSMDPFFSFWGSPFRAGGTLNLLLYMALAIFSYLVVNKNDWKKIWILAFIAGAIVSFIAIAQQFKLISEDVLVIYSFRPPSTMGNTNFLATYLVILFFLALGYAIKEQKVAEKIFYWGVLPIFLFTIGITQSKGAYLAITAGLLLFFVFVKIKNIFLAKFKLPILSLLIIFLFSLLLAVNNPSFENMVASKNKLIGGIVNRLSFKSIAKDSRFSGWKIGLEALKNKPILGYGPENFSIGFDKFYTPGLSNLSPTGEGSWWDRAHNFLLDIGITMGIPALLAYLSFWIILLLYLQKVKKKNPEEYLMPLILQVIFIAYFLNNFFSFDCAPTYIISHLLIGYSLCLVSRQPDNKLPEKTKFKPKNILLKFKGIAITGLSIFTIFFIWQYNVLPLKVNAEINWANYYSDTRKDCAKALDKIAPVLKSDTIIDSYLRQSYASILINCINREENKTKKNELILEGIENSNEAVRENPHYTRSWLLLGIFNGFLLEQSPNDAGTINKIEYYFNKALELSPRRSNIVYEWGKIYLIVDNCQESLKMAERCLSANKDASDCWWLSGLSNICLKNQKLATENIKTAQEKGYDITSENSAKELIKIYTRLIEKEKGDKSLYYRNLIEPYRKLSEVHPEAFQNHASLAYIYKALREYEKAREEAMAVLKLSPDLKATVEEFLRTLP